MIDVLHIGDFKTGTTWMQRHGFAEHPEICYLGDPVHMVSDRLNRAVYEVCEAPDLSWNPDRVRIEVSEVVNAVAAPDRITVLSREALLTTNYLTGADIVRNAHRIREVFGRPKIVLVIREPKSMLVALYSQYIKMGGTLSLSDFFFDAYETRGLLDRMMYSRIAELYYDLFGADRVYIDLFERFRAAPIVFLSELYGFVGCKKSDFLPDQIESPTNRSLTTGGAELARLANRLIRSYRHHPSPGVVPLDKLILAVLPRSIARRLASSVAPAVIPNLGSIDRPMRARFAVNVQLNKIVRRVAESVRFGEAIILPARIAKTIDAHYLDPNRVLEEKYGLPVTKYGWVTRANLH